jgi:hypothetical protein
MRSLQPVSRHAEYKKRVMELEEKSHPTGGDRKRPVEEA